MRGIISRVYVHQLQFGLNSDEFGNRLDRYGAEITGSGRDMEVNLKLDGKYGEYWMGYATNKVTNEVIGYNTKDLKSILEDITKLQSEEVRQAPFDKKKFNTPQRFNACIEEVQQSAQRNKEPEWDFANEDNLER